MAAAEHIGALISVDCGEHGVYQGKILSVNDADQSITLERPFHNGTPQSLPTVTLSYVSFEDCAILFRDIESELFIDIIPMRFIPIPLPTRRIFAHLLPTPSLFSAEDILAVKILKLPTEFAAPNLISAPRARAVRAQAPNSTTTAAAASNRPARPQRPPTCAASLVQSSSVTPSQTR